MGYSNWTSLLTLTAMEVIFVYSALPAGFYKTGEGTFLESWSSWRYRSYGDTPSRLSCPSFAKTLDKFEVVDSQYTSMNKYYRVRSYFVSPQSGNHRFFAICRSNCIVRFYQTPLSPNGIISIKYAFMEDWSSSKRSPNIRLLKGFRYLIDVAFVRQSYEKGFFKLGVTFPDNTEVKPIDGRYLRRSMEFFKWTGFLVEEYKLISGDFNSVTKLQQANAAKYPANPDSVSCRSLYDTSDDNYGYNIALRYTGYFNPKKNGDQTFKMECNAICSFTLTKSSTEKLTKIQNEANEEVTTDRISLDSTNDYLIEAFKADDSGRDYMRVRYRNMDGDYRSRWISDNRVKNINAVETLALIPFPSVTVINSTALNVKLTVNPYLPPRDNWNSTDLYEVVYNENTVGSLPSTVTLNGNLPKETVITGLKKYTWYSIRAHYYGKINSSYDYNLISGENLTRTAEDVPTAAPPNFRATTRDSTTIIVQWNILSDPAVKNGIIIGYDLKYAVKESTPKIWKTVNMRGTSNRYLRLNGLQTYTVYQFQVAANTSQGAGVFSHVIEARTAESKPTMAPSNVTAENTSSSSIIIKWDEVPKQYHKGVIIKYTIFIVQSPGRDLFQKDVPASKRTYEKTGLKYWTFYYVWVSASTSVGRGPLSSFIKIRTDEDKPSAPPQNIKAKSLSSTSIKLEWSNINAYQTNGIIISYEISYQRTDGKDIARNIISYNNTVTISGLKAYWRYDVKVAGITKKGRGTFSLVITEITLQDAPSSYPTSISGGYVSSTAILVRWKTIPVEKRNGIISKYNIKYRLNNSNTEWSNRTVDSSTFNLIIRGLRVFSLYEFIIAGGTVVGLGPYSLPVVIKSDADGPVKPPSDFSGEFINHTSIIMKWSRVPKGFRSGIVLGYKLRYKDRTIKNADWVNCTISNQLNGPGKFSKTINDLKIFTPYVFIIAGFTYRSEGVYSREVTVWTDEYIPDDVPRNISSQNITSTGLALDWKDMAEAHGAANGRVLGYNIRYRVIDCREDRPKGCDENQEFMIKTPDSTPHISLQGLRKYTNYSITFQVFNVKGEGNISEPIYIKTLEDKPDAAPTKLETWPSKYNSIQVYWSPIPESLRNGIIIGYRIFYKPIVMPLRKYNRAPRSINPFAIYGAFAGEKMLEVNASIYQVEVMDLKDYSWYRVRIGALTIKGLGVTFFVNATCKQGSPIAAPKFYITDEYDFYEIRVRWSKISHSVARGEVLGYRIRYWTIEVNDQALFEKKVSHIDVLANSSSLSFTIKNLQPYAKYGVTVSAFTEGGFGVLPPYKTGETCRCPKILTTSWMRFSPLINANRTMLGILPKYIEEAVDNCCGNCSGGQGPSDVDWVNGGSSTSSLKYTMHGLHEGILSGSHITVPLFRDIAVVEGNEASLYDYVPFVISPGMAVFKKKPTLVQLGNEGAKNMATSIFCLYPVFVILVLITTLAGMFFWVLERGDNTDEFPDDFFRGSGSGFWLAFITMTTAGYGDIAPKTILGRIFAVVWTLVGIVITSLIVGSLANALASTAVAAKTTTVVIKSNEKTLASEETFMISIVKLKSRTVIGNTSDPEFVKQALLSGNVSRVILEAYDAVRFKDALEHPDIEFETIKKVESSYGVALRGPARRIKHCLNRFVQVHSQHMLEELNEHPVTFKRGESSESLTTKFLLSPDADITIVMNKFCGITLVILIIVGTVYDIIRRVRGRTKIEVGLSDAEKIYRQLNIQVEDFVKKSFEMMNDLEYRHAAERRKLADMNLHDLKAIAPHLTIFDENLRPKNTQNHCQTGNKYSVYHDNSDESDFSHPMDYKASE